MDNNKEDNWNQQPHNKAGQHNPPMLEWIVGAVGLVIVVVLISFLIYEALTESKQPPTIVVNTISVDSAGESYLVRFELNNTGSITGADVTIEGTLSSNGEVVETSQVTVPYVPPHSVREGGLYFSENPAQYDLQIRALGYRVP